MTSDRQQRIDDLRKRVGDGRDLEGVLHDESRRRTRADKNALAQADSELGLITGDAGISRQEYAAIITDYALNLNRFNREHAHLASNFSKVLGKLNPKSWGFRVNNWMADRSWDFLRERGERGLRKTVTTKYDTVNTILDDLISVYKGAGDQIDGWLETLEGVQASGESHYTHLFDEQERWKVESKDLTKTVKDHAIEVEGLREAYVAANDAWDAFKQDTPTAAATDQERIEHELEVKQMGNEVSEAERVWKEAKIDHEALNNQLLEANQRIQGAANSMRAQEAALATTQVYIASFQAMKVGYEVQEDYALPILEQQGDLAVAGLFAEDALEVYQETMDASNRLMVLNSLMARTLELEVIDILQQPFWNEDDVEAVKEYARDTMAIMDRFRDAYQEVASTPYFDPQALMKTEGLSTKPLEVDRLKSDLETRRGRN